ncbi:MAG: PPC domain-containing protein [Nitrosomonas sp.]|nr:MAG: PPC domain-containing protein [Nitrosomonas sp.]
MALIPNFPKDLLDIHHHWHDPSAHPGSPGGRNNPFGTPGAGLEFLQFHHDFMVQFHAWYDTQPFADQSLVLPWATVPVVLKNPAVTGWNSTFAAQENRIITNNPSFSSEDALGAYIEGGIHGWIHPAVATAFNEPVVANFHSPQSTYFYQIHGLVDKWWRDYVTAQIPQTIVQLAVDAPSVQASISRPGEVSVFSFVVFTAGNYTIETQGSTDVVARLYGPNNMAALITEDDDSGDAQNSRISSMLSAGTYYVRVRHYRESSTGNYSISVKGSNQQPNFPTIQVNGAAIDGVIAVANESDVYTFAVTAAGTHLIETAGNTDCLITLFGPDSQTAFIAQDDDSGPGTNSRIATNLAVGTYYVRVAHYSPTGTGTYSIFVRR